MIYLTAYDSCIAPRIPRYSFYRHHNNFPCQNGLKCQIKEITFWIVLSLRASHGIITNFLPGLFFPYFTLVVPYRELSTIHLYSKLCFNHFHKILFIQSISTSGFPWNNWFLGMYVCSVFVGELALLLGMLSCESRLPSL